MSDQNGTESDLTFDEKEMDSIISEFDEDLDYDDDCLPFEANKSGVVDEQFPDDLMKSNLETDHEALNDEITKMYSEMGEEEAKIVVTAYESVKLVNVHGLLADIVETIGLEESALKPAVWDEDCYAKGLIGEAETYNAIMIGDEFVNLYDIEARNEVWNYLFCFRKFAEDGCTVARSLELLEENYNSHVKLVIFSTLHYELAKKEDGFHVIREDQGTKVIDAIVKASEDLKKKYPNITFVWTVPTTFDFVGFNNELLEKYCDKTKKFDRSGVNTSTYARRALTLLSKLTARKLVIHSVALEAKSSIVLTKKLYQRVYNSYGASIQDKHYDAVLLGDEETAHIQPSPAAPYRLLRAPMRSAEFSHVVAAFDALIDNQVVSERTKLALLMPFFYDLVKLSRHDADMFIQDTVYAMEENTTKWRSRFPSLKIVWVLPHEIDLGRYQPDFELTGLDKSLINSEDYHTNLEKLQGALEMSETAVINLSHMTPLSLSTDGRMLTKACYKAISEKIQSQVKNLCGSMASRQNRHPTALQLTGPRPLIEALAPLLKERVLANNVLRLYPVGAPLRPPFPPHTALVAEAVEGCVERCDRQALEDLLAHANKRACPWTHRVWPCGEAACDPSACPAWHGPHDRRRCPVSLGLLTARHQLLSELCYEQNHLEDTACKLCHNCAELEFSPKKYLSTVCSCTEPSCLGAHQCSEDLLYHSAFTNLVCQGSAPRMYRGLTIALQNLYTTDLSTKTGWARVLLVAPSGAAARHFLAFAQSLLMMRHFRGRPPLLVATGLDEAPPTRAALSCIRAVLVVRSELATARPAQAAALRRLACACPPGANKVMYANGDYWQNKLILESIFDTTFEKELVRTPSEGGNKRKLAASEYASASCPGKSPRIPSFGSRGAPQGLPPRGAARGFPPRGAGRGHPSPGAPPSVGQGRGNPPMVMQGPDNPSTVGRGRGNGRGFHPMMGRGRGFPPMMGRGRGFPPMERGRGLRPNGEKQGAIGGLAPRPSPWEKPPPSMTVSQGFVGSPFVNPLPAFANQNVGVTSGAGSGLDEKRFVFGEGVGENDMSGAEEAWEEFAAITQEPPQRLSVAARLGSAAGGGGNMLGPMFGGGPNEMALARGVGGLAGRLQGLGEGFMPRGRGGLRGQRGRGTYGQNTRGNSSYGRGGFRGRGRGNMLGGW